MIIRIGILPSPLWIGAVDMDLNSDSHIELKSPNLTAFQLVMLKHSASGPSFRPDC